MSSDEEKAMDGVEEDVIVSDCESVEKSENDISAVENNHQEDDDDDDESDKKLKAAEKAKTKEKKSGVVYLSRVPTCMNVKQVCEMLSQYGAIGRVFLKPDARVTNNKKNRVFEEGWIEFERKKVAKLVAATLNNKPIGGKRRSPWFHELWNLKYLKGFKWTHLNEKLTYERAVRKQKLKLEISKAKKETDKFAAKVEKQRKSKQSKDSMEDTQIGNKNVNQSIINKQPQIQAESSMMTKKNPQVKAFDKTFLSNIFSGGLK